MGSLVIGHWSFVLGGWGRLGGGDGAYKSRFFTLIVICLTSGPLPLARGGLGWGPPEEETTEVVTTNFPILPIPHPPRTNDQ